MNREPLLNETAFFQASFLYSVRIGSCSRWPLLDTKSNSVQFSRSVVSYSLQPHGLQHARLPCPSPTPEAWANSCPLSQWCHPTISFSVIPFSSCLQSFPASGSFQMSQFFSSKLLEFQLQHQSFQWIFRIDFLKDGLVGSPCSPTLSLGPNIWNESVNETIFFFLTET